MTMETNIDQGKCYICGQPATWGICDRDDCQQDKDKCCDCWLHDLYKSPDQMDYREDK